MRGFVPTPVPIVDVMVDKLFEGRPPTRGSRLLDPGCGPGAFIDGVLRCCSQHHVEVPEIVGVELDPQRAAAAAARFRGVPQVSIVREDFLRPTARRFDYVLGNPPYVAITSLGESEKAAFRKEFLTARGRFDPYLLFFEPTT